MAFRNYHPISGIDARPAVEAVDKRYIPLFPALVGLLAVTNIASVVFVLTD